MFKLGKLTDYGTVVMTVLAQDAQAVLTAQQIADRTHLTVPTVAKLLKQLTRARLLMSLRGANGGYRLARDADAISVSDIVAALEGPVALTECAAQQSSCSIQTSCGTRANWRLINTAIQTALASVTLAQMAAPPRTSGAPRGLNEFPLIRAQ